MISIVIVALSSISHLFGSGCVDAQTEVSECIDEYLLDIINHHCSVVSIVRSIQVLIKRPSSDVNTILLSPDRMITLLLLFLLKEAPPISRVLLALFLLSLAIIVLKRLEAPQSVSELLSCLVECAL